MQSDTTQRQRAMQLVNAIRLSAPDPVFAKWVDDRFQVLVQVTKEVLAEHEIKAATAEPTEPMSPHVLTARMTQALYDEITALEVDTYDGRGPSNRAIFVQRMEDAKKVGRNYLVHLPIEGVEYLRSDAIPNMINIWEDQRSSVRGAEKSRLTRFIHAMKKMRGEARKLLDEAGEPVRERTLPGTHTVDGQTFTIDPELKPGNVVVQHSVAGDKPMLIVAMGQGESTVYSLGSGMQPLASLTVREWTAGGWGPEKKEHGLLSQERLIGAQLGFNTWQQVFGDRAPEEVLPQLRERMQARAREEAAERKATTQMAEEAERAIGPWFEALERSLTAEPYGMPDTVVASVLRKWFRKHGVPVSIKVRRYSMASGLDFGPVKRNSFTEAEAAKIRELTDSLPPNTGGILDHNRTGSGDFRVRLPYVAEVTWMLVEAAKKKGVNLSAKGKAALAKGAPAGAKAPRRKRKAAPASNLTPAEVQYTSSGIPVPGSAIGQVGMDARGNIWGMSDEMKAARAKVQVHAAELGRALLKALGIRNDRPSVDALYQAIKRGSEELFERGGYGRRSYMLGIDLPGHRWPVYYVAFGSGKDEWQKGQASMTYEPMGKGKSGLWHMLDLATNHGARPYRIGVVNYQKVAIGSGGFSRPDWFIVSPPLQPPVEIAGRTRVAGRPSKDTLIKAFRRAGWTYSSGGANEYLTDPNDTWRLMLKARNARAMVRGESGKGWHDYESWGSIKQLAQDTEGTLAEAQKNAARFEARSPAKLKAAREEAAREARAAAGESPEAPAGKILLYHSAADGTVAKGETRPAKDVLKRHGFRWYRGGGFWYVPRSRGLAESPKDLVRIGRELGIVEAEVSEE